MLQDMCRVMRKEVSGVYAINKDQDQLAKPNNLIRTFSKHQNILPLSDPACILLESISDRSRPGRNRVGPISIRYRL